MANYLLKPVFESVFDREFQQTSFEDRLEMQKTIYLLQNLGISVGNYNFLWYKHGPYSQTLQNDILRLQSAEKIPVDFSNDAKTEINALKSAFLEMTLGIVYASGRNALDQFIISKKIYCLLQLQRRMFCRNLQ